jgi:hypothetical protein
MDADMAMAIGTVLGVLSIPSLLSAMSEGRAPKVVGLLLIAAGGLVIWALATRPGGYSLAELPGLIIDMIARIIG